MSRIMKCVVGMSMTMVFAALAPVALAQAPSPAKAAKGGLIETLREAHRLLAHADKDYAGHRHLAAEEIHKAIKDLEGHKLEGHKKGSAGGQAVHPAHPKGEKVHEIQVDSDAQMRAALGLLQGAVAQFNGKHPHASKHVGMAIKEINTALATK